MSSVGTGVTHLAIWCQTGTSVMLAVDICRQPEKHTLRHTRSWIPPINHEPSHLLLLEPEGWEEFVGGCVDSRPCCCVDSRLLNTLGCPSSSSCSSSRAAGEGRGGGEGGREGVYQLNAGYNTNNECTKCVLVSHHLTPTTTIITTTTITTPGFPSST